MTLALVLLAYAAATAASSAAFLPGGLGLVDGALLAALVAGGVPSHPALAAVLLYRLVSFVGVAAAGWVAWFVIHAKETPTATVDRRRRRGRSGRDACGAGRAVRLRGRRGRDRPARLPPPALTSRAAVRATPPE